MKAPVSQPVLPRMLLAVTCCALLVLSVFITACDKGKPVLTKETTGESHTFSDPHTPLDIEEEEPGPDKLGSWAYIQGAAERPDNWEQIVYNSPFQLGEKVFAGTWFEGSEDEKDYYYINYGTFPCIDGSTVAVPMAVEFAWQHLGMDDSEGNIFTWFSTTDQAYTNLITKSPYSGGMIVDENALTSPDQQVDILIATEPSADELALAKKYKVKLIQKPVCWDAFVFIVNKDNPVDSLTLDQVRGIYSGKITNWKELGGQDLPIVPYQREENSGSQTGMINLVMGDTPMLPPERVDVVFGMGALIDAVAEYQNSPASIGYTYKYYIDTLYKNDKIKILKINGVSPNPTDIRSGAYPLSVNYYGIIRAEDAKATGGLFLDWMLTPQGQECIAQAGYIPL